MKTTREDFEYFKERCIHWIDKLELSAWDVHFVWGKTKQNCLAESSASFSAMTSAVTLDEDWGSYPITKEELDATALHEVLHIMFCPITAKINEYLAARLYEPQEHELINKLIRLLIPQKGWTTTLPSSDKNENEKKEA